MSESSWKPRAPVFRGSVCPQPLPARSRALCSPWHCCAHPGTAVPTLAVLCPPWVTDALLLLCLQPGHSRAGHGPAAGGSQGSQPPCSIPQPLLLPQGGRPISLDTAMVSCAELTMSCNGISQRKGIAVSWAACATGMGSAGDS